MSRPNEHPAGHASGDALARHEQPIAGRRELLLAIDTCGVQAGAVLGGEGRTDVALLPPGDRGHARTEDLSATVSALLAARGRNARDLTLLGAIVGPGSYTGLRSGLAFLRGLAFADGLPAVAVGTTEFLAWRVASVGETVFAACPAGAGRSVVAAYRRTEDDVAELTAPQILDDTDCARFLADHVAGHVALVVPETATAMLTAAAAQSGLPLRVASSDGLARLGVLVAVRAQRGETIGVDALLPAYVGQSTARPNHHRVAVLGTSE